MRDERDVRQAGGGPRGRRTGAAAPRYRLHNPGPRRGRGKVSVRVAGSRVPGRQGPSTILVGRDDIPQFRNRAARNGGWNLPSLSSRQRDSSRRELVALVVAAVALVAVVALVVRACAGGA